MNTISRYFARLLRRRESEEGVILVIFALMLTMICLFAGLAINLGAISQTHQNAQDSSDSAALAGATLLDYVQTGVLSEPQVVAQVENYVISNYTTYSGLSAGSPVWNTCPASTPFSSTTFPAALVNGSNDAQDCIALNSSTFPNIISVALPPLKVTDVLGNVGHSQNVTAVSTAAIPATSPCALCVLQQPTGQTLQTGGLFDTVNVTGAGIDVDSGSNCAVNVSSLFYSFNAPSFNVVGTSCGPFGGGPSVTRIPAPGVADPLSNLPVPCTTTTCQTGSGSYTQTNYGNVTAAGSNQTLNPGIYGNITADTFAGSLTLNPGIYVITGSFDYSNAGGVLQGTGVTMYFTCQASGQPPGTPAACATAGQAGGSFSENSGADLLNVSPPTAATCATYHDCPYVNLDFFYDRHDTSNLILNSILGANFFGTIYAASATYETGGFVNYTQDSLLVVGQLNYQAFLGSLNISYSPSQNVPTGQSELCNNSSTGNNC